MTKDNIANATLRQKAIIDALEDTQNAIRFLKSNAINYHIDATRIAVFGASAGGALSLINAIQADFNGLTNDFKGYSSKVNAAISTGATLVNDDISDTPVGRI